MRRDDTAILLDIAHAATLVARFLTGKDKTALTRSGAPRRRTFRNSSCG